MGSGQSRRDQRSEVFVKIQHFFFFFWGGGGVGVGSGEGVMVYVNREVKFL